MRSDDLLTACCGAWLELFGSVSVPLLFLVVIHRNVNLSQMRTPVVTQ